MLVPKWTGLWQMKNGKTHKWMTDSHTHKHVQTEDPSKHGMPSYGSHKIQCSKLLMVLIFERQPVAATAFDLKREKCQIDSTQSKQCGWAVKWRMWLHRMLTLMLTVVKVSSINYFDETTYGLNACEEIDSSHTHEAQRDDLSEHVKSSRQTLWAEPESVCVRDNWGIGSSKKRLRKRERGER